MRVAHADAARRKQTWLPETTPMAPEAAPMASARGRSEASTRRRLPPTERLEVQRPGGGPMAVREIWVHGSVPARVASNAGA